MSTPLFQEALIEAKKLREAAAAEAKNAVLEAVSPMIKQMIDREISGVILEQEEPVASEAEVPPPAPPAPSPDAGTVAPVEPAPEAGSEATASMPGMTPAVAKAAPPIVAPEGTSVPGKFETDPATGQPQIVLNINDLFTKTAPEAAVGTEVLPTETPAPESVEPATATPEAPAGPPAEMPAAAPEEEGAPAPQALAEIYRAVNRLLAEQKKKAVVKEDAAPAPAAPAPPALPTTPDAAAATPPVAPAAPGAAAPIAPVPNAAAPAAVAPAVPEAVPPATPGVTPEQMMGAVPPATPAAAPAPAPAGATPPAASVADPNAVPPAAAPAPPAAPAPVQEYKDFKTKLVNLEETVGQLVKRGSLRSSFIKENHEKEVLSLYKQLVGLRSKNAISSRVFGHNEERLDLLNENLNLVSSYTKNPPTKENVMKTKNSLRDFARSLFEGAEGFEKEAGHVDPAGDSEGGSAEHAHHVSGNPKGHKAEAEKAKFATKEKSEWPGKPAPTSLLEQLEEEIAEMMGGLHAEEEGLHEEEGESDMEEAVLEMDEEEVMMEARKARARLKALREQAEGEEGGEDHLSLTIDLDGVSGEEVENVNVSLDGEELDVDMEEEGGEEEGMEMSGEEEVAPEGEEEEEEEGMVSESRVLRKQLDETQLLTARSLYLNKLFVRDDLSGAQKRKIVEYLDSARTIAEAKEIYNRVTRVLNTAKSKGMVAESATRPTRMLNEAVEPSFDTSRWQILAGVKKTAK